MASGTSTTWTRTRLGLPSACSHASVRLLMSSLPSGARGSRTAVGPPMCRPSCCRRRWALGLGMGVPWHLEPKWSRTASSRHSGSRAIIRRCTPDCIKERMAASSRQTVRVQKARSASRRTATARFPGPLGLTGRVDGLERELRQVAPAPNPEPSDSSRSPWRCLGCWKGSRPNSLRRYRSGGGTSTSGPSWVSKLRSQDGKPTHRANFLGLLVSKTSDID
jgi:hypothetical protein